MTKTLEKPAAKPAKCRTPFPESKRSVPGFLGNQLWPTPPSFPSRARCQKDVLPIEFEEGAKLIEEYRQCERIARDNDLGARNDELWQGAHNERRKITDERRQQLNKELLTCNHQEWLAAQSRLNELKVDAADLAKTILQRLIVSFDTELQETAIAAEERLNAIGVPLSNGENFEFWLNVELLWRHSWREVCRHKLQQFEHSSADISIGCVQWLTSAEESVPFAWL